MRANTYRAMGDLDQAISDHTESSSVAPGWEKSYSDRGANYFQKDDFSRALDDISKVPWAYMLVMHRPIHLPSFAGASIHWRIAQ
jgi:hypothetical protein